MTAPICHGTAGGCTVSHWSHLSIHTASCPTLHCIGCPQDVDGPASIHYTNCPLFTPPTKRTMGQCLCQPRRDFLPGGGVHVDHQPDCPALYPLQRQPGDEKDALTRLTAHVRTTWVLSSLKAHTDRAGQWESTALDFISEAREEHKTALAEMNSERLGQKARGDVLAVERDGANERARMLLDAKNHITASLHAELSTLRTGRDRLGELVVSAKALITTLNNTQSEVRQQALKEGREQGHMDALSWMRSGTSGPILRKVTDSMAEALDALRGDS